MGQEFSGHLRERVIIERQAAGRDALGSAQAQFEPVGQFWAAAKALPGGEDREAESRSAMPRWRFVLRETQAIQPGDRLIWAGRVMVIDSVILEHRLIPKTILQAAEQR